jgi:hypothetical protein
MWLLFQITIDLFWYMWHLFQITIDLFWYMWLLFQITIDLFWYMWHLFQITIDLFWYMWHLFQITIDLFWYMWHLFQMYVYTMVRSTHKVRLGMMAVPIIVSVLMPLLDITSVLKSKFNRSLMWLFFSLQLSDDLRLSKSALLNWMMEKTIMILMIFHVV